MLEIIATALFLIGTSVFHRYMASGQGQQLKEIYQEALESVYGNQAGAVDR